MPGSTSMQGGSRQAERSGNSEGRQAVPINPIAAQTEKSVMIPELGNKDGVILDFVDDALLIGDAA
jgi:hypothetical protein